jgi:hypothetical protein
LIINSFKIKIDELSEKSSRSENEQNRLKEKLKIHEQLIQIKSDIEYLKNKNGKKR